MHRDPTIVSLVVGLLVVSGWFWALERWRPSIPTQRRTRSETVTDVAYWFFTPLVTKAITRVALGIPEARSSGPSGRLVCAQCHRGQLCDRTGGRGN